MIMTKPSVNAPGSEWLESAWTDMAYDADEVSIRVQRINGVFVEHYAIYIDGKRQRKTYFGETARWHVARDFNDLVHWTEAVYGDEL
jgi:hypothetical protein